MGRFRGPECEVHSVAIGSNQADMRNTLPLLLLLALAVSTPSGPATAQVEVGVPVVIDETRVVTLDITGMT